MRTFRFFALVGIFSAFCLLTIGVAGLGFAQTIDQQPGNFVVIGAFAIHKNAINFTSHARQLHFDARFEMNQNRHLYYVYVLNTEDREQAINEARKLREETEFKDTWVFGGLLGEQGEESKIRGMDINPITQQKIEAVKTDQQPANTENKVTAGEEIPDSQVVVSNTSAKELPAEGDVEGKRFLFKIFRANDNSEVEGDVDVIDSERTRKMGTYKGNIPVKISPPNSKSGKVSIICEVFGYRKVQKDIDFNNPEGEQVTIDEAGNVVVPFELARLQKGDIAVMYNVYFFKDAGVMRPESRYEVGSLLDMLKENPNYEIKIHGHTNGSAHGKIISMGKDSENYFSLTDTKDGFGSAKKLSEERAQVIFSYLVSNGIDPKRMHVKAWGGKRPVHDKHSTRAQENVRVEIEILED